MKKLLLLLPLLLTSSACVHTVVRAPTSEEIRKDAPRGTLIRITLVDRAKPFRFTSFLVDVGTNGIASQTSGSSLEELEALEAQDLPAPTQGATAMQTSTNTSLGGLLGSQRLNVDCEEYANDQTTCLDLATNGDPRGTSDGPGDPTGDPRFARLRGFVLRVAALHYWSLREAGMPLSEKPVSRPVQSPTRQ